MGCLKNYCECYEAKSKIPCTDASKCMGRKNVEEDTVRKRELATFVCGLVNYRKKKR